MSFYISTTPAWGQKVKTVFFSEVAYVVYQIKLKEV